jgi:hypothetical protein
MFARDFQDVNRRILAKNRGAIGTVLIIVYAKQIHNRASSVQRD